MVTIRSVSSGAIALSSLLPVIEITGYGYVVPSGLGDSLRIYAPVAEATGYFYAVPSGLSVVNPEGMTQK